MGDALKEGVREFGIDGFDIIWEEILTELGHWGDYKPFETRNCLGHGGLAMLREWVHDGWDVEYIAHITGNRSDGPSFFDMLLNELGWHWTNPDSYVQGLVGMATLGSASTLAALNPAQSAKFAAFTRRIPNGDHSTSWASTGGGGKVFYGTVPGKVPGSFTVYRKGVDPTGKTTSFSKVTHPPKHVGGPLPRKSYPIK